jgi:hypothetical protein
MYTNKLIRTFSQLAILSAILGIAACSGDDLLGTPPTDDTTTTSGGSTGDTGGTVSSTRIGSTVTGIFTDGILLVTPASLSAGGTAAITANLVDANGSPVTTSTTVNFSSPCVSSTMSAFSNPTQTTTNGVATTNYVAQGCTGSDVVTATINGTTQSASGTITVASVTAGSVQFDSVTDALIALSGTGSASGLPENSTVKFIVKDALGLPVQNEDVAFSLNSAVGGITLSAMIATSDGLGEVITTVQSGSVATSVRVTATLVSNPLITTTSTAIAIATGPPDQDSISLAASTLNPRAWDINGKEVTISAFLADRFNNPITDGTAISFTTELGAIDPSCITVNGGCSVIWRSQNPRVNNIAPIIQDGITTILATVEGEESFIDTDVDGVFSDGDAFTDLDEAFRDDNDNGTDDTGEFFVDFNVNGILDAGNGLYNGKGCTHATLCDISADSVTVRKIIRLVMSEDVPTVLAMSYNNTGAVDASSPPTFDTSADSSISITIGGAINNQILPSGTTINFSTTNGTIVAGGSHTVGESVSAADTYTVFLSSDGTSSADGFLTYEVTIGDGGGTYTFVPIAIDDIGQTYSIGGTVSGLPGGETVTLQNNAGNNLAVTANGVFTFTTPLPDTVDYEVTVGLQPATATCAVALSSGTVAGADVTDVTINCI